MTNNTPIILDRLDAALAAHGIKLRRNQLLDVAAAAHGFRNGNAFSAAAKSGELDAVRPEPLGTDDHGLTVLRDPASGSVFAIDPLSPASRAQQWCLSPYGGVIDVAGMKQEDRVGITVHTAMVSHKHGTNFYVAQTSRDLDAEIAGYCEEWWNDARERDDELPETTDGLDNSEIASLYFAAMDDEYVDTGSDTLLVPRVVARAVATTPTGEAWAISRTDLESDDPVLWWSDADGWGDLASASVYPDRTGRLPTLGMDESSVEWQRLPGKVETAIRDEKAETRVANSAWTTVTGSDVETAAAAILAGKGIQAADGIAFGHLDVQTLPDERRQDGFRKRVVLRTIGEFDPTAVGAWYAAVKDVVAKAGGAIATDAEGAVVVFDGDAAIAEAESAADWLRAVGDLLQPVGERPRVMAYFRPEAWVLNNAVEVDREDSLDRDFDVTYEMLLLGREAATQLTSGESDYLREAVRAPAWISDWSGPFTVIVDQEVDDSPLFD